MTDLATHDDVQDIAPSPQQTDHPLLTTGADQLNPLATTIPFTAPLSVDFGGGIDLLEIVAALPWADGRTPHRVSGSLVGNVSLWTAIERLGVQPFRSHYANKNAWIAVYTGPTWAACFSGRKDKVNIEVYADTIEGAVALLQSFKALCETDVVIADDTVMTEFAFLGRHGGPSIKHRPIETPTWEEIKQNYSATARPQIERLVKLHRPVGMGHIILLHGAPGTGKTTLIRSLIREWKDWAAACYVIDPEQLFTNTDYLNNLVLEEHDDEDYPTFAATEQSRENEVRPYQLYIVEDTDEVISSNAKDRAGQALARLLNLTDGILGQGLNALFLITTNEPLEKLHPAVVRPGRCIADIEVGLLSQTEAREWLDDKTVVVPKEGLALADLFAKKKATPTITDTTVKHTATGQYL